MIGAATHALNAKRPGAGAGAFALAFRRRVSARRDAAQREVEECERDPLEARARAAAIQERAAAEIPARADADRVSLAAVEFKVLPAGMDRNRRAGELEFAAEAAAPIVAAPAAVELDVAIADIALEREVRA